MKELGRNHSYIPGTQIELSISSLSLSLDLEFKLPTSTQMFLKNPTPLIHTASCPSKILLGEAFLHRSSSFQDSAYGRVSVLTSFFHWMCHVLAASS